MSDEAVAEKTTRVYTVDDQPLDAIIIPFTTHRLGAADATMPRIFDPENPATFFHADELDRKKPTFDENFKVPYDEAFRIFLKMQRAHFHESWNRQCHTTGQPEFRITTDMELERLPRQAKEALTAEQRKAEDDERDEFSTKLRVTLSGYVQQRVLKYMLSWKFEPLIWDTQIVAIFKLFNLLKTDSRKMLIDAHTQAGKSGILLLASMMWQLHCITHKRKEHCYNIAPNSNSISSQTINDGYEIMTMTYGCKFEGTDGPDLCEIDYEKTNEFHHKKSMGGPLDRLAECLEDDERDGWRSILFVDEGDEATNLDSFLDRLLGATRVNPRDGDSPITKVGKLAKGNITVVYLTATGYGFLDAEEFDVVQVETGPNYRSMFHLPNRKVVPVVSFGMLHDWMDLHDFHDWKNADYNQKLRAMDQIIPAMKKGLRLNPERQLSSSGHTDDFDDFFGYLPVVSERIDEGSDDGVIDVTTDKRKDALEAIRWTIEVTPCDALASPQVREEIVARLDRSQPFGTIVVDQDTRITYQVKMWKVLPNTVTMPLDDVNGIPWQGGRGAIIRFSKKKGECESFGKYLESKNFSYMRGVTILRYWGDHMRGQWVRVPGQRAEKYITHNTIEEMVDAATLAGVTGDYIIIVADSARRGDRVPNSCPIAIECTKEQSGAISRLQGLAGRMTGHKDADTMVICSDRDYLEIKDLRVVFRATGRKTGSGKIGPRLERVWRIYYRNGMEYLEFKNPKKNQSAIRIDREDKLYTNFTPMFTRFEKAIGKAIRWRNESFNAPLIVEAVMRKRTTEFRELDRDLKAALRQLGPRWLKRKLPDTMPEEDRKRFKKARLACAKKIAAKAHAIAQRLGDPNRFKAPTPEIVHDRAKKQGLALIGPTKGNGDKNFVTWNFFGKHGYFESEEFRDVVRFLAGQEILTPNQRNSEGKGARSLKSPESGPESLTHVQVTPGSYDRQVKLGLTRRGLTGDRSTRSFEGRNTRVADKNPNDLNIDLLFELLRDAKGNPIEPRTIMVNGEEELDPKCFRARLLTVPLRRQADAGKFHTGEMRRVPEVYFGKNSYINRELYTKTGSQGVVDLAVASKPTRPKRGKVKPKAPPKRAQKLKSIRDFI